MNKVIIDTNVVIDALAAREPFRKNAEKILTLAAEEKIVAYITGSSVTDIYYIVRRKLSHNEAVDSLKTLLEVLRIVSVGEDECVEALESTLPDFEDAVVVVCAGRVNADCIVSRDEQFAKTSTFPVQSPEAFLMDLQRFS